MREHVQDFGPVRLMLPSVDTAILWRRFIMAINASENADPVDALLSRSTWAAAAAASMSAITDAEGNRQTWGDLARGKIPAELVKDPEQLAAAAGSLRDMGASLSELVTLGDEIVIWLTAQILAPVEAAPGRAGFFAPPKVG
jgi:hypothetical protein